MKISNFKIKKIIKESIKKVLSENYQLTDLEELMEYMRLKPTITFLNVDIFVDDGGSYKRNNHIPLLFARNSYDNDIQSFIPFSISSNPKVLDDEMDFNISYDDIFNIQDFINNNVNLLLKLADEKISQKEFVSNINFVYPMVNENKKLINEMATLRCKDSGLPMDIWLDENKTYEGHAPRLKFRANFDQRTTREFSSMLLTNPPEILNFPEYSPLRKKDIEKLKKFVINNLDLLLKLANGEINYVLEFLPNIIID